MRDIQLQSGGRCGYEETGGWFLEDHTLEDIAWGLARQCRFAGQIKPEFEIYTVAQHSVWVAEQVAPSLRAEALMHDATEAFIRDIPGPYKKLMPDYAKHERELDLVIRDYYQLPKSMSPQVHLADMKALATERRDLVCEGIAESWPDWDKLPNAHPKEIVPVGIHQSFHMFMKAAEQYGLKKC